MKRGFPKFLTSLLAPVALIAFLGGDARLARTEDEDDWEEWYEEWEDRFEDDDWEEWYDDWKDKSRERRYNWRIIVPRDRDYRYRSHDRSYSGHFYYNDDFRSGDLVIDTPFGEIKFNFNRKSDSFDYYPYQSDKYLYRKFDPWKWREFQNIEGVGVIGEDYNYGKRLDRIYYLPRGFRDWRDLHGFVYDTYKRIIKIEFEEDEDDMDDFIEDRDELYREIDKLGDFLGNWNAEITPVERGYAVSALEQIFRHDHKYDKYDSLFYHMFF